MKKLSGFGTGVLLFFLIEVLIISFYGTSDQVPGEATLIAIVISVLIVVCARKAMMNGKRINKTKISKKQEREIDAEITLESLNEHLTVLKYTSVSVFDFCYSYEKILTLYDELIALKEWGVKMEANPLREKIKFKNSIGTDIEKLFERGISKIKSSSNEWTSESEQFIYEIESNELLSQFISSELSRKIGVIKSSITEKERIESAHNVGLKEYLDCKQVDSMLVIRSMESNIQNLYKNYLLSGSLPEEGMRIFSRFEYNCETSELPLAAEIRLEGLLNEYRDLFSNQSVLSMVDQMEGHSFEYWCASLLKKNGFSSADVTPGSGDHGVDIIAVKDGIHYAIQCKCYSHDLGNSPVQEVYAGKEMYRCQVGVVMTNRYFTPGAKQLAEQTRVLLWDRDKLKDFIESAT